MSDAKTVSVGCKLPNGIICQIRSKDGQVVIQAHTLKGANDARIVGGYGITDDVPADFMTEWLRLNAKHPAVVNGSIFTHADSKSAEVMAKDRREAKTGLEGIDPVKSGMLDGPVKGSPDPQALATYNKLKAENPDRNRQRVE